MGSEYPTLVYHHGSGERPLDLGRFSTNSFRRLFLGLEEELPVNLVAVRAPFHDGSSREYARAMGDLENFVGMLATSVGLLEALTERIADRADGPLPPDIVATVVDGGISLAGYGQGAMALAGLDFLTKLRSFDDPVLLLNGAEDRLNPNAAETLEPKLPAAETSVVPDAGRTCSIERPDKYTAIIREFATERVWAGDDDVTDESGSKA
ncbi:alpha/beta fold hydrolase [Halorubrum sp. Ea8]|uniref:alpha/beta fold hydrolase n=1 Tax=Halorubrum sp. Ea8 TaxID=1383841 RepID=UPI000B9857AD|nr:alpha/beta hydrolase [Halorubrum sp. Ea8]OYR45839.1 hypothetical protein DJ74_15570 [Halorubrum sp. Ea8]